MPRIEQYIAQEKLQGPALPTSQPYLPQNNIDLRGVQQGVNNFLGNQFEKYEKKRLAEESLWLVSTATEFESNMAKTFQEQKDLQDDTPFTERMNRAYDGALSSTIDKAPSDEAKLNLQKVLLSEKNKFITEAMQYEASVNLAKNIDIVKTTTETMSSQVFHQPQNIDKYIERIPGMLQGIPANKRDELASSIINTLGTAAALGVLENIDSITDEDKKLSAYKKFYNDIESGKWNKYLKSDDLIQITGESTKGIKSTLKEIKAREEEAYSLMKINYSSSLDDYFSEIMTYGSSNRIDPKVVQLIAAHEKNPQLYADFIAKKKATETAFNVVQNLDYNNIAGSIAAIEKLKPKPGEKGFAIKQQSYEQALGLVRKRTEELNKDPAATVKQTTGVLKAFERGGLKGGTLATVAAQVKNGVSPDGVRLLTKGEAKKMAEELNKLSPQKLEQRLTQLDNSYNFNYGYGLASSKIMSEIQQAGLNKSYGVALSLRGTPAFNSLIYALQQGKELDKSLPPGIKPSDVDTTVRNKFAGFRSTVSYGGKRPTEVSHIEDSAIALTKQYIATRGLNVTQASELAYKQIITDNYHMVNNPRNNKNKLLVPKVIGGKDIDLKKLQNAVTNVKDGDLQKWLGLTYQNPVGTNPKVTTKFGQIDGLHSKPHAGVDFAGYTGQTVKPVTPGKVTFTGFKSGYGKTIEITHDDGSVSRYAHLNSIEVIKGDVVDSNKRIGGLGSTGRSTGPHLHLELMVKGKHVNPMNYIDKAILGSESGFSNITVNRQTLQEAQRKPVWLPNSDGTGLVLAVDAGPNGLVVLRNFNGNRFIIPFKSLTGN